MAHATCTIRVNPDDLYFARRAMLSPNSVPADVDLILGRTDMSDGISSDLRLCGTGDGKPAHMCAAIFTKDELIDYIRTEEYETLFVLCGCDGEYEVRIEPDPSVPSVQDLLELRQD